MDKIIEILVNKWYLDCLVYNIPVSPSDVKDIVEELIELACEVKTVCGKTDCEGCIIKYANDIELCKKHKKEDN